MDMSWIASDRRRAAQHCHQKRIAGQIQALAPGPYQHLPQALLLRFINELALVTRIVLMACPGANSSRRIRA